MGGEYPACVRIKKPPEDAVLENILHAPAPIQENGQHALPQLDDASVFLRFSRLRGVVCHCVLLGDGGYNERRMQIDQRGPQRCEFRVPSPHFKALYTNKRVFLSACEAVHTPVLIV
jgi:hypothetical protein